MRIVSIILIAVLLFSCTEKKKESFKKLDKEILKPMFQSIIDSSNVKGSILIYDLKNKAYYSNDFNWAKIGRLPASTFKITNSIIALETTIVENDSTVFKWNGEQRAFRIWEQDLTLKNAFHYSCVPCYQEIARKIGSDRMNTALKRLNYTGMVVNANNIDLFWLVGDSKINQFQQIDFLKRFYKSELKITKRTETIIKRMIVIEENDTFKLSGKTGLSITNGNRNGWFVGYFESKNNTYFFATNIKPKDELNLSLFLRIRKEITLKALKTMNE